MNNYKILVVFLIIFNLSHQTNAQQKVTEEEEKLSLNSGTLDNQFEFVIQRSNNYQDYKVVKKTWLYALKAHTLDSLKAINKNLVNTQNIVDTQSQEIAKLKSSLTNTQESLEETNLEKDSMSLFGLQMSKSGYNTLLWSVIGALLALLLLFIYKFKNSNTVTKEARKALAETEEEFEDHRRVALEREQKVRRQLQDELNKHKNSK
ncbi:tRNA (guanine-N1)-methyltransferase [Bizionia paragorgiae]|uniref:tRNA (guanine-N1)-methyltransferase n=1 Tax=Bizionia paragorgiae TaxID=283786 RepID=UPI00299F4328|nr:tRNA (guanine-N1)-methyltransferase [Bizionia paragorgiae]MDX1270984.1 tRNA (guanine-N1)-methyltransferase [Bizionia paragorgiae]